MNLNNYEDNEEIEWIIQDEDNRNTLQDIEKRWNTKISGICGKCLMMDTIHYGKCLYCEGKRNNNTRRMDRMLELESRMDSARCKECLRFTTVIDGTCKECYRKKKRQERYENRRKFKRRY